MGKGTLQVQVADADEVELYTAKYYTILNI